MSDDQEFELVLGNKQILSIFFLVVVLFAIFFSLGYSVGFNRGEGGTVASAPDVEAAGEPPLAVEAASEDAAPPRTPLEDSTTPAPVRPAAGAAPAASSKPSPLGPGGAGRSTPASRAASGPPVTRRAAARAGGNASGSEIAKSFHLQVAALRVRSDAQMMVEKLKARGYPVALHHSGDDEWHRVLVGPFSDAEGARSYKERLSGDGLDSILRRPRN